jgi:hypothetical protein
MKTKFIVLLSALALLGIPALFGLIYYVGYRFDYLPAATLELVVLGTCVVVGMVIVYTLPFERKWVRAAVGIAYGAVMAGMLFFIALGIACANGNCL